VLGQSRIGPFDTQTRQASVGSTASALHSLLSPDGVLGNIPGYDQGLASSAPIDLDADGTRALVTTNSGGNQTWLLEPRSDVFDSVVLGVGQQAQALSADGTVVVGSVNPTLQGVEPARWDAANGGVPLDLSGVPMSTGGGVALNVSGDGSRIVGWATAQGGAGTSARTAFLWDATTGTARTVADVLANDHGLDLTGWTLREATDISADGRTIVGNGIAPDGTSQGWRAFLASELAGQATLAAGDGAAASLLSGEPAGGVDITLDGSSGGTLSVTYSVVSRTSVVDYDFIAGDLGPDALSGVQAWDLEFGSGSFTTAQLVFGYDDTGLTLAQEQGLFVYHRVNGEWVAEATTVDTVANTLSITTDSFSPFLMAGVPGSAPLSASIVPEPSSGLLLAMGLVALSARRKRREGRRCCGSR